MRRSVKAALGALAVTVLTGVLLLNIFPHTPSSLVEWALLVLVRVPS